MGRRNDVHTEYDYSFTWKRELDKPHSGIRVLSLFVKHPCDMDEYKAFGTGEATVDVASPSGPTEFTNFDDEVARFFECMTNLPDDPERKYPAWIDNEFHEVIRSLSEHSCPDYQDNPYFYPFLRQKTYIFIKYTFIL